MNNRYVFRSVEPTVLDIAKMLRENGLVFMTDWTWVGGSTIEEIVFYSSPDTFALVMLHFGDKITVVQS